MTNFFSYFVIKKLSKIVGEWFYEILGPQKNPIAAVSYLVTDVFVFIHVNSTIPFIFIFIKFIEQK